MPNVEPEESSPRGREVRGSDAEKRVNAGAHAKTVIFGPWMLELTLRL